MKLNPKNNKYFNELSIKGTESFDKMYNIWSKTHPELDNDTEKM